MPYFRRKIRDCRNYFCQRGRFWRDGSSFKADFCELEMGKKLDYKEELWDNDYNLSNCLSLTGIKGEEVYLSFGNRSVQYYDSIDMFFGYHQFVIDHIVVYAKLVDGSYIKIFESDDIQTSTKYSVDFKSIDVEDDGSVDDDIIGDGIVKYLILDDGMVKKIYNEEVIDICSVEDLNGSVFIKQGNDQEEMEDIYKYRHSLISDVPKILVYSKKAILDLSYKEIGIPLGSIIEMKNVADISPAYIKYVRNINVEAYVGGRKDILKFAVSNDGGRKWFTYYEGEWIEIIKNNAIIIDKGMSLDVLNNLTEAQLQKITEKKDSFKILWYMQKDTLDSVLEVRRVNFAYSTTL